MSHLKIYYFIALPLEEPSEYSPLQGYPPGLLLRSNIVRYILRLLPPTLLELFQPSIQTLQQRIAGSGSYAISPLISTEFQQLEVWPSMPFCVVFIDEETASEVKTWADRQELPVLLVNTDAARRDGRNELLLRDSLQQHCKSVIDTLRTQGPSLIVDVYDKLEERYDPDDRIQVKFTSWLHNTTMPNELALLSVGAEVDTKAEPLVGDNEAYLDAILYGADLLATIRNSLPSTKLYRFSPPAITLMITSPGIYTHVRKIRSEKNTKSPEFYVMLRLLQKQQTYSILAEVDEFKRIIDHPISQLLLGIRTQELCTQTDAIAVRSASCLCPVLRFPPAVDHVLPAVIRLSDSIRSKKSKKGKTRRLALQVFDELEDCVDGKFIDRIDQPNSHIKIISDAPLEWLPIRGLPLMLRYTTSRIPTTPGALSYQTILPPDEIRLFMDDFRETLVIRSFRDDDPLRTHLEYAIKKYRLDDGSEVPARFVDVSTENEFVEALNSFNGSLVVFDGHGSHGKSDDIGVLHLRDEKINVWKIKEKAKLPPIFFTCACDTHAVNRSHATTAAGLLYCGTRTVLASVLPIESWSAAVFTGRLLFRIYQLLPSVTRGEHRRAVRWDGVVSLLQRMQYVTELIYSLEQHHEIPDHLAHKAEVEAVMHVHREGAEWYERTVETICEKFGLSSEEIEQHRLEKLTFAETMKYLQLGNPESILICPDEFSSLDIVD